MQWDSIIIALSTILLSAIVVIIVCVWDKKHKETTTQVISTSKRYAYMLKQKEIIRPEPLDAIYTINRYMNSTTQLDRLNIFNQMVNIIQGDLSLQDMIVRCQKNETLFSSYLKNMQNAPDFLKREDGVSKMYIRIEHKLSDEISNDIRPRIPTFHIHFEYTSPKGRNTWYKNYDFSTEEMVEYLIQCERIEKNKQSAQYQRSIMSASMRYDVMKRDGFRCVLCGRGASDGVKLHVDHIVPIARGGKTIKSNLRTLCEDCNLGKKDKYDQFGMN